MNLLCHFSRFIDFNPEYHRKILDNNIISQLNKSDLYLKFLSLNDKMLIYMIFHD